MSKLPEIFSVKKHGRVAYVIVISNASPLGRDHQCWWQIVCCETGDIAGQGCSFAKAPSGAAVEAYCVAMAKARGLLDYAEDAA
jgi:hypothetical protein